MTMPTVSTPHPPATDVLHKLPEVTLLFWVMKISATTLGETSGDLLSMTLNLGYALSTVVLAVFFVLTLLPQLQARSYRPLTYWSVILSTTMVGTTISDFMDRSLHLGYVTGSAILLSLLLLTFAVWRLSGLPFDMAKIRSRRAEAFYWTAILLSNTLGTALGDFFADTSGLGYAGGAELMGAALLLAALAARFTPISKVFLFWLAFVLTRPFGATLGDLFTKPVGHGGLGVGTVGSSLLLAGILGLCLLWAARAQRSVVHSASRPGREER
jgi:uncharacterized membrane-anchored protein